MTASRIAPPAANPAPSAKVREVAQRIEEHITAAGFSAGDRYLDARQLSLLLGESEMMAQRAMKWLASRNIVERRPRAGTFIAHSPGSLPGEIRLIVPDELLAEPQQLDEMLALLRGVREALPRRLIQLTFTPVRSLAFTKQSLEGISSLAGVLLIVPSREMRSYFNQSGIPTVVVGAVEPDLTHLCSLQFDQYQLGQLFAAHLLKQGHRRIATLMRDIWGVGDYHLHDGLAATLGAEQLPTDSLLIRCCPNEPAAIYQTLSALFLENPNPPTALICRSQHQLEIARTWSRDHRKEIALALCNHPTTRPMPGILATRRTLTSHQMGQIAGELLAILINGEEPAERHLKFPIELILPPPRKRRSPHG